MKKVENLSENSTQEFGDSCCTAYRFPLNKGLMGHAHATSAVALSILALALYQPLKNFIHADTPLVMLCFVIACTGAGMLPDLDNSKATVISALGITGKPMSFLARESSRIIQIVIRTPKDPYPPNPHRGFWHTFVGAGVAGMAVFYLTTINYTIIFPSLGDVSIGDIVAFIVFASLINIMNASLPNSPQNTILKKAGSFELASILFSLVFAWAMMILLPENIGYIWLATAITIGMSIHILGDALTVQGVPMFFPLIGLIRGRLWWKTRFTKIQASSKGLNNTIIISSVIIGIIGVVLLLS